MNRNVKFAGWTALSLMVHGVGLFGFSFPEMEPSASQPAGIRLSLVQQPASMPAEPVHLVKAHRQPGKTERSLGSATTAEPPERVVTPAENARKSPLESDPVSMKSKMATPAIAAESSRPVPRPHPKRPAAVPQPAPRLAGTSPTKPGTDAEPAPPAEILPDAGSSPPADAPPVAAQQLQQALTRALLDHFSYPLKARHRHWEGEVVLRVTILHDGQVGSARIDQSSGYRLLDQAALKSLRQIRSLAGFTLEREVDLLLPVIYRLRG